MDSLRYATTIQQSILPFGHNINKAIANHAVIFKPKDLVSGDFYWFTRTEKYIFLAVVDCTGHGVLGAFMSLIGHEMLENIVHKDDVTAPSQMLSLMNKGIRSTLQQDEKLNSDGMDVCLCRLEYKPDDEVKLCYAGAKRPLFFTQSGHFQEQKGTRKSVGGYQQLPNPQYDEETFSLRKGDFLYLSTDGFVDQHSLGYHKYGTKRLRKFLSENSQLSLNQQYEKLSKELETHQGVQEQRDDITVFLAEL